MQNTSTSFPHLQKSQPCKTIQIQNQSWRSSTHMSQCHHLISYRWDFGCDQSWDKILHFWICETRKQVLCTHQMQWQDSHRITAIDSTIPKGRIWKDKRRYQYQTTSVSNTANSIELQGLHTIFCCLKRALQSLNPTNVFFLKIALAILASLSFHIYFKISLPISKKNSSWCFDWNCIKPIDQFGGALTFLLCCIFQSINMVSSSI